MAALDTSDAYVGILLRCQLQLFSKLKLNKLALVFSFIFRKFITSLRNSNAKNNNSTLGMYFLWDYVTDHKQPLKHCINIEFHHFNHLLSERELQPLVDVSLPVDVTPEDRSL